MKKTKRSIIVFLMAAIFLMTSAIIPAASATEAGEKQWIRLGTTGYRIQIPADFIRSDPDANEITEGGIGYWYSTADNYADFDLYQFPKAGLAETLSEYVIQETEYWGNCTNIVTGEKINGIEYASYNSVDTYNGKEFDTFVIIFDAGEWYVELLFWMDGETVAADVTEILNSIEISPVETKAYQLGTSNYQLTIPADFIEEQPTQEEIDDDAIAHLYNKEGILELIVYQFAKAEGEPADLAGYTEFEAELEKGEDVSMDVVNGINAGSYVSKHTRNNREYDAAACILDAGDTFVEVLFLLPVGLNSLNAARQTMTTLAQTEAK